MSRFLLLTVFAMIPLLGCDSKPAPAAPTSPEKSAMPKPAAPDSKPMANPAAAKPDGAKPDAAKPAAAKPAEPMADKPMADKPKPMAEEASAEKSAGDAQVDPVIAKTREFIAGSKNTIDKTQAGWKTHLPKPPKQKFDPARKYFWVLDTSEGEIRVQLMPDVAPMHVSSTIYLTELGFYDDLSFHRVIPGFMAQGGDPLGNGTGSAGYKYDGEFSDKVLHTKGGLLSMANSGPGTDGSQFFLTFVPTPHLNGKHTIFGEVVAGMDVLKKLESFGSSPQGTPKKPLLMKTAKIVVE